MDRSKKEYELDTRSKKDIEEELLEKNDMSKEPSLVSVLLLYSLETPSPDLKTIHNLLAGGLSRCGINVHSPHLVTPQELDLHWVERMIRQADAILLIANRELQEEWQCSSSCAAAGSTGRVQVGYAVRQLLNRVEHFGKFAYVCLAESDCSYTDASYYINTKFVLSQTDIGESLEDIARFIFNRPKYIQPTSNSC